MKDFISIGIDPGTSGGFAILSLDPVDLEKMPKDDPEDIWNYIRFFSDRTDVRAFLEKVGGFMGAGAGEQGEGSHNRASGHTMFRFGANYGMLKMALIAAGIPFTEVHPKTWQKEFGIAREKGEKKPAFKKRIRAIAQKLFPKVKVTAETADALLLAEYGRRHG